MRSSRLTGLSDAEQRVMTAAGRGHLRSIQIKCPCAPHLVNFLREKMRARYRWLLLRSLFSFEVIAQHNERNNVLRVRGGHESERCAFSVLPSQNRNISVHHDGFPK